MPNNIGKIVDKVILQMEISDKKEREMVICQGMERCKAK